MLPSVWDIPAARRVPRRSLAARIAFTIAVVAASLGGGCAYQLGSLVGSDAERAIANASTAPKGRHADAEPTGSVPAASDLGVARLAIGDALGRTGQSTTRSVPWENAVTGARGTVTALSAGAGKDDGRVCRDFLASHIQSGRETWLSGEACRQDKGRWEVQRLTPWKRT